MNSSWSSLTYVHFGNPGAFSDHSPATVRLSNQLYKGWRSFKFFNMWASHDQFLDLVSNIWHSYLVGSPIFILCKKLKLLKRPLKDLNKFHFSHISKQVSRAETTLENLQTTLQANRDHPLLL